MKIFEELIKTKEFQRLKGITLGGFNVFLDKNNPLYIKNDPTVYEHSLGVYKILDKIGASEEEKIIGLLHDISRPAFGHIIDFVFADREKQEWHERMFERVLKNSEIEKVLKKYGYDWVELVNNFREGKYKYLDFPIPDICADRLDYSLRHIRSIFNKDLFWILDYIVPNDILEFSNEKAALEYSLNYLELAKLYAFKHSALYEVISAILRKALDKKIIKLEDFFEKGEKEIYDILCKDEELKEELERIKNIKIIENRGFIIKTKCRYIDPKVNGKRLSEINKEFRIKLMEYLDKCKKGIKVEIFYNY